MTLELAYRSITRPKGVAKDVFVKVGKFYFSTDFVVVDFEADPRVPLILRKSFLRTGRTLIDVYGEEITLRVNDEAVTFNLNQTRKYSSTYDDMSVSRIDVIDVPREEYAQEILGFSNNSLGGNPTSTSEPIIFDSSPSLTPFEGSDFILEEIEAYLKDESISPEIDHADCDPKGDICLIEKLINDDPFQLPPMDLNQGEVVKAKYLIKEPSELGLKDLPSHLEYAYLEGVDKLPVIIAKDLKDDEKEALLKMLFNNTIKWIEAFVPMDTELVKGSEKIAEGSKKAQEGSSKRAADKLKNRSIVWVPQESWALLEDLSFYDNESWNDPKDFAKPVKAITLPQDVLNPEQAFVEYASSRTDKARDTRLSKFEAYFKQQQIEMTNKIDSVLKAIPDRTVGTPPSDTINNLKQSTYPVLSAHSYPTKDPEKENKEEEDDLKNIHDNPPTPPDPSVTFITEKVLKFNSFFESLGLVPPSSNTVLVYTKEEDGDMMFIEIVPKDDNSCIEEPKAGEQEVESFDIFSTRSELAYHKHVHVENAYIDLNSPLNIMTRMMYNWITRRKLEPRENTNGRVSNFIGRVKKMHFFIGNFTYVVDFMIIEDISSIIDPRLSQVVLGKPFVEISNMTHDPPEGVATFTNENDEVAYKMPHKIEQYNSLSNLEKEHIKLVYLRNKEDKRRGVEYVMNKILGFYKECLELGPEYATGIKDEGKVT
uniref:Reverse transcriptase domain-containing protein n=1 Tax=Tanacetum cinerariifolium TaxID=118510 RepID=A0A6L2MGW6_TANCI|nr:reverse transcriptase domain-containing protein [Tanacetum cinerariifolium]